MLVTVVVGLVVNIFLAAVLIVLNDWVTIEGDKRNPNRANRTFLTKSISRNDVFSFAMALIALWLMVLSYDNMAKVGFALMIAPLSAVFAAPNLHAMGMRLVNPCCIMQAVSQTFCPDMSHSHPRPCEVGS